MELPLDELALVDHAVLHVQLAVAVVPALLVLALVLVAQPVGHQL